MLVGTTATPKSLCEIMTADPVRITRSTSAYELAQILESNEISGVPVVDELDRPIGVVSRTDLLHRCIEGPAGSHPGSFLASLADGLSDIALAEDLGVVEEFMSTEPVTATGNDSVAAVASRMACEVVHRVIVVDDEECVIGIVTSLDMLRAFRTR